MLDIDYPPEYLTMLIAVCECAAPGVTPCATMARSLDKLRLPVGAVLSVSLTCTVLRHMDPATLLRFSLTSLVNPRWKFAPHAFTGPTRYVPRLTRCTVSVRVLNLWYKGYSNLYL